MTADVRFDKCFLKASKGVFQLAIISMHEQIEKDNLPKKSGRDGNEKRFKKKF